MVLVGILQQRVLKLDVHQVVCRIQMPCSMCFQKLWRLRTRNDTSVSHSRAETKVKIFAHGLQALVLLVSSELLVKTPRQETSMGLELQ